MAENTNIGWCDHTMNVWWGCEKVSPACAHCYAEQWDKVCGGDHWGKKPRKRIKGVYAEMRKVNAKAERPQLVFTNSMADIFEDYDGPVVDHRGLQFFQCDSCICPDGKPYRDVANRLDVDHYYQHECGEHFRPVTLDDLRADAFDLMRETDRLVYLLLTKRPENIMRMMPDDLLGHPRIWFGTTVETPEYFWRAEELIKVPSPVHFISAEPQLEYVDFAPVISSTGTCTSCACQGVPTNRPCGHCGGGPVLADGINWLISGGESKQGKGHNPRPYDITWPRRDAKLCELRGVPFNLKQLGDNPIQSTDDTNVPAIRVMVGGKGDDPSEWPKDLCVQQRPQIAWVEA